jgi:hypothetical protein
MFSVLVYTCTYECMCTNVHTVHTFVVTYTEYTECWPCPLFDILLNEYFPLASLVAGRGPQCSAGPP